MRETSSTRSRLIDAAVRLMLDQGSADVEMVQVAAAAGVSRTTLYRHFPTRDALLEGLFDNMVCAFRSGMRDALAARPALEERISAFVEFIEEWLVRGRLPQIYAVDAALMLRLSRNMMPSAIAVALDSMAPVFDMADLVNGAPLDRVAIAEVFVHFSTSLVLFPADGPRRRPGELMAWVLHGLLKMPPP